MKAEKRKSQFKEDRLQLELLLIYEGCAHAAHFQRGGLRDQIVGDATEPEVREKLERFK